MAISLILEAIQVPLDKQMKTTIRVIGVVGFFGIAFTAGLLGLTASKIKEAIS